MKKVQLPVVGGIRKTIVIPDANLATTLQGYAGSTLTVAQLRAILGVTPATNTGNGNIGPPGQGAAPKAPQQTVIIWSDGDGGGEGSPGPPGNPGPAGANGTSGGPGPAGPAVFMTAEPGEDGWPAIPGNPGPAGANGTSGGAGPAGPAVMFFAEDGQEGEPGPPGAQGPAGAAGGASSPFNLAPESHTTTPTFVQNDEMELSAGTAVDTTGTRFAGATAWTWGNQSTATALYTGDGSIILAPTADGVLHGIYQPASGIFKRRARFYLKNPAGSAGDFAAIFAYNSGTGHIVSFGPFPTNGPTSTFAILKWSNFTTFSSVGYNALPFGFTAYDLTHPIWYELRSDGTTLTFALSPTGVEGTFIDITTETIATFLTTVDNVGLCVDTNSSPASSMVADLWRKY